MGGELSGILEFIRYDLHSVPIDIAPFPGHTYGSHIV